MIQPLGPCGVLLHLESLLEMRGSILARGFQMDRLIGVYMSPIPGSDLGSAIRQPRRSDALTGATPRAPGDPTCLYNISCRPSFLATPIYLEPASADFLIKDAPRAAVTAIDVIRDGIEILERHPFVGRPCEDAGSGLFDVERPPSTVITGN